MTEPTRRRHPAARARVAAAGVGITAVLGLAANMELASNQAQAANTAAAMPVPRQTVVMVHPGAAPGTKAAKTPAPIVLTVPAIAPTVAARQVLSSHRKRPPWA